MQAGELTLALPRQAAVARAATAATVVPYTPLWYAARVLRTSAAEWWEGGVPPARGRRQRAARALSCAVQVASQAASGMAHRLHGPRQAA